MNRTAPVVDGPTEFKMIRTTNVRNGFIDVENVRYVNEATYKKWTRRLIPKRYDVILTREAPLGGVGMLRTNDKIFLGQRLYHFRADPDKLDPHFLLYALQGEDLQGQIHGFGSGSTVEHMRLADIPSLELNAPNIEKQRRIGGILSAYDDLIENNLRRIQILEEMAQSLYREWFVHFRFPGHESTQFKDSPLGPIPQDWEAKPVGELLDFFIGGGWGKEVADEKHTEPAFVIRGTDIPNTKYCDTTNVPFRVHGSSNLKSRRLQDDDIVFEVSGGSKGQPVGRALYISKQLLNAFGGEDVMCASFCKLLRPRSEVLLPSLLFYHLLEIYDDGRIDAYQVQSTGITNFKFTPFTEQELIAIPPRALQSNWQSRSESILKKIAQLGLMNQNLRQTRDLLLPKLLSGGVSAE